jgi:arylsulfatase A-like enzyme
MPQTLMDGILNFTRDEQPDAFNRHRPLFLLVNLPAPRSAVKGADVFPVPSDAPYSDSPWPQAAKNRAALITRIDGNIGRLMEELPLIDMTNNVAIIFSSSAPPEKSSSTNLDFLKLNGDAPADMKDALKPLPLIVWWPHMVPAGRVSDAPLSNADLMATLLELARADKATDIDGVSRARTFRGLSETNRVPAPH